MQSYLKRGSYNAVCDGCGFNYKKGKLQKRWDGLMVCMLCFEQRHPQDYVKGRRDQFALPWTRPVIAPEFIPDNLDIRLYDEITPVDTISKHFSIDISNKYTTSGAAINVLAINGGIIMSSKSESVMVTDSDIVSADRSYADGVGVADSIIVSRMISIIASDILVMTDAQRMNISNITHENIYVTDDQRNFVFNRITSDSVTIADQIQIVGAPPLRGINSFEVNSDDIN